MICPNCNSEDLRIRDSFVREGMTCRIRRYVCSDCGAVFFTREYYYGENTTEEQREEMFKQKLIKEPIKKVSKTLRTVMNEKYLGSM